MRESRQKSPREAGGLSAGDETDYSNHIRLLHPRQGPRHFVPARLRSTLTPLFDPGDVDLAVKLRGALRNPVNRGDRAMAAYFGDQCARLVLRQAEGVPW